MIDTRTAPYAALFLRVTLGVLFLVHDALKFFVFTPAGTEKFFAAIGLPGWMAWVVMLAELVAGVALILGIATRWVAAVMILDLLGAIVFVHIHNGFFFNDPKGGWEYPLVWAIALGVQALLGSGALAFDNRAKMA